MYTSYFGFREEPFNLTPTSHFFYTTPVSEEAYTQLLNGIKERKELMVLTGEVGTGKTSLLRRVMNTLEGDPSVRFALFYYMAFTFDELLTFICEELGVAVEEEGALLAFTAFVQAQAQAGVTTVLLIDEAQDLAPEVLEELASLVNPQTANNASLQIILVGQQPELEEQLNQPRLSSLKQSIAQQCRLVHLKSAEVTAFIDHRLLIAGYTGQELFSPEAIQLITAYSQRIPRVINLICDNALRLTCAASQTTVSAQIIQDVARCSR
jgi:general secretion pathway protein A